MEYQILDENGDILEEGSSSPKQVPKPRKNKNRHMAINRRLVLDPDGKAYNTRSSYGELAPICTDVWYELYADKAPEVIHQSYTPLKDGLLNDRNYNFTAITKFQDSLDHFDGWLWQESMDVLIGYNHFVGEIPRMVSIVCDGKYYTNDTYRESIDEFLDYIEKKYIYREKVKPTMKVVVPSTSGLTLNEVDLSDKVPIDLNKHYNDDFKEVYETVVKRLNTKGDKGLILFYGVPGSSKSTLIRHLTGYIKKKSFIFLPNSLASKLASPDFLKLLLNNKDSILIVEDAEDLLIDRGRNYNKEGVSNLLNIADGLLSDVLNIQVICTFNCDIGQLDKALLRKGRLIAKYEFGPLSVEKSNNLLKELGHNYVTKEPMVATDIFNFDQKKYSNNERPKIGFK